MWDTATSTTEHLSHDLPCVYCGHAPHHYLPCDRDCDCGGALGFAPIREAASG